MYAIFFKTVFEHADPDMMHCKADTNTLSNTARYLGLGRA